MMPEPITPQASEPLFPNLAQSGLACAARLLYAVLLTLVRHRRLGLHKAGYPVRLVEVVRAIRYDARFKALVREVQATAFERQARVAIAVRLLLSFWAWLIGVPVADLCVALNTPEMASLRHALGLRDDETCYPQRVAELHSRLGPGGVAHCREVMVQILLAHVPAERLSEADVEAVIWSAEQDTALLKVGVSDRFCLLAGGAGRPGSSLDR